MANTAAIQSTGPTQSEPRSVGAGVLVEIGLGQFVSTFTPSPSVFFGNSDHAEMARANTKTIATDVVDDEVSFNEAVLGELVAEAMSQFVSPPTVPIVQSARDGYQAVSASGAAGCPCPNPAPWPLGDVSPEAMNSSFVVHGCHYDKGLVSD